MSTRENEVGAGSAGATVAFRLSKNHRVLLLEAGGHPYSFSKVPGFALDLVYYPQWDWMHSTVPQTQAGLALRNNVSLWPRGKVLGGSSTLNYMLYLRGHPQDYDNWARITGDKDWNYENVLPFFRKSLKRYTGKFAKNKKHYEESPYGFLNVESAGWSAFVPEFFEAARELGYTEVDANGPQEEGFSSLEVTQLKGERYGTYAAIIKKLEGHPNIDILTYAQATKVKLDKNGQASGVYYCRHGTRRFAKALKEVILSGGSVDSPKLLMLSGIGPAAHLKSVGIKPKVDLPVGENLEDHLTTAVSPFTVEVPGVFANPDKDFGFQYFYEYFAEGKGPLTTSGALVAQAFLCSDKLFGKNPKKSDKCKWPDLQVYFAPLSQFRLRNVMLMRAMNLDPKFMDSFSPPTDKDGFYFVVALVRPQSKGRITLSDKDPFSNPKIDPRYLNNPKDLDALVNGIKFMLQIGENTTSFQKVGSKFSEIPVSGCESYQYRSDDYWKCYVKHLTFTIWHPTGTCKMGKDSSDKTAVVDSKLRVLHTKGLRVADASIMPVIVNANTNAPAIMIGEKAAAFIRQYWADQYLVSKSLEYSLLFRDDRCYYSKLC